jgi:hypothetical protein
VRAMTSMLFVMPWSTIICPTNTPVDNKPTCCTEWFLSSLYWTIYGWSFWLDGFVEILRKWYIWPGFWSVQGTHLPGILIILPDKSLIEWLWIILIANWFGILLCFSPVS